MSGRALWHIWRCAIIGGIAGLALLTVHPRHWLAEGIVVTAVLLIITRTGGRKRRQ